VRHIVLSEPPDEPWVRRAITALQRIKKAADDAERAAIIDRHRSVWSDARTWLLSLSHDKCWFSEAKDCFNHWDVEHYRPKKAIRQPDGSSVEGYWWLAFDWRNFRICGTVGNRAKGAYFPLRNGSAYARPFGDLRYEEPALLDPADPEDPLLLTFNMDGEIMPRAEATAWERERVELSVTRYRLDWGPLTDKRKVVWAECWRRCQVYLYERELCATDPDNAVAREQAKTALRDIRAMLRDSEELSSVARACLFNSGDPRLLTLLQSV
jgi:hypothetical protein